MNYRNSSLYGRDEIAMHFELKWPVRRLVSLIIHNDWSSAIESVPGFRRPNSIKIGKYSLQVRKSIGKAKKYNSPTNIEDYLKALETLKDIQSGAVRISFEQHSNLTNDEKVNDSPYYGCPSFRELFSKMCEYGELYGNVEETPDMRKIIQALTKLENCAQTENVVTLKAKFKEALEKEYNKQRSLESTCPQD
jgi:hypothetical protein